jgi:hypothetical protein
VRVPPDSWTNRLRRGLARDGLLGLGDLLVDAAQGLPGSVGFVLVVDDLVPAPVGGAGGPGLAEDVPVGDVLARMLATPLGHDVGNVGDAGPEDERQAGFLDRLLVGRGDHAGISHDRHVRQPVGRP